MPTTEDTGTDGVICPRKLAVATVFVAVVLIVAGTGTASAELEIDSCTTIDADNAPNDGLVLLNQSIQDASPDSCINITTSNIILDGQNNTVEDDVSGQRGINVTNPSTTLSNVTVRNITVTVWNNGVVYDDVEDGKIVDVKTDTSQVIGILLNSSSDNNVTDNNATDNVNGKGISLRSSSNNNNLTDNNASANGDSGIRLASSNNNNVTGNVANSNDFSGINIFMSSGNELTDNDVVANDDQGFDVATSSDNNDITENNMRENSRGIRLDSTSGNSITDNNVTQNFNGIIFDSSNDNNDVIGNNVSGNDGDGITLRGGSDNNNVTRNKVVGNRNGIEVDDSADVELARNLVQENNVFGVRAENASGLKVSDSLFTDNDVVDLRTSELTVVENITFNRSFRDSVNVTFDLSNLSNLGNNISGVANMIDINETLSPPADPNNAENIGLHFNTKNRTDSSFFNVSVKYTDAAVSDVDESSLSLWEYENTWSKVPGSTVDTNTNTVGANITDFSVFAPLAETGGVGGPFPGGECVDRRDISRGQESQECPKDRTIGRGESREDIDRKTGRNSDTARRDRGRGERGRGR